MTDTRRIWIKQVGEIVIFIIHHSENQQMTNGQNFLKLFPIKFQQTLFASYFSYIMAEREKNRFFLLPFKNFLLGQYIIYCVR